MSHVISFFIGLSRQRIKKRVKVTDSTFVLISLDQREKLIEKMVARFREKIEDE